MANEKKKMTAPDASVGADTRQSNSQINNSTIPDPAEKAIRLKMILKHSFARYSV